MTRLGDWKRKTIDTVTGKPDRFSWVIENILAGSALPQSIGAVQWLTEQGIKSIVTIREEPLADEWINDVNYLHIYGFSALSVGLVDNEHDFCCTHKIGNS